MVTSCSVQAEQDSLLGIFPTSAAQQHLPPKDTLGAPLPPPAPSAQRPCRSIPPRAPPRTRPTPTPCLCSHPCPPHPYTPHPAHAPPSHLPPPLPAPAQPPFPHLTIALLVADVRHVAEQRRIKPPHLEVNVGGGDIRMVL